MESVNWFPFLFHQQFLITRKKLFADHKRNCNFMIILINPEKNNILTWK